MNHVKKTSTQETFYFRNYIDRKYEKESTFSNIIYSSREYGKRATYNLNLNKIYIIYFYITYKNILYIFINLYSLIIKGKITL